MNTSVFQRFRELITEVAPEICADELKFDVLADTDGAVHVYECLTGTTTSTVMTLRELESADLCHVGMHTNDGLPPQAILNACVDAELTNAVTVQALTQVILAIDTDHLRTDITHAASAVRLADWYLTRVERWFEPLRSGLERLMDPRFEHVRTWAALAVERFLGLHTLTVGHESIRQTLGRHDNCLCPTETVALAPLSPISFVQHVTTVNNEETTAMELAYALLSSYKDCAVDQGPLYDLPSCVLDLVVEHLDMFVRSARFPKLSPDVRHAAEVLWTPDDEGPLADFTNAVYAAEKLLVTG